MVPAELQMKPGLFKISLFQYLSHPVPQMKCKRSERMQPSEQRAGIYMQFVCVFIWRVLTSR